MAYIYIEPTERTYAKAYRVHKGSLPATIDVKRNYPQIDYSALSNEDFVCGYVSDGPYSDNRYYQTNGSQRVRTVELNALTINHNYNPSTGVLSVSASTSNSITTDISDQSKDFSNLKCEVIMIVDGIKSEYT